MCYIVALTLTTIVPLPAQDNDRGAKAVRRLRGTATTGMSTDEILALTRV